MNDKRIYKNWYTVSQFGTSFSEFTGSLLTIGNKNNHYWMAGTLCISAIMGVANAFTAHQFQGRRIACEEEPEHPQHPQKLRESTYLFIQFSSIAIANFVMFIVFKALVENLQHPDHEQKIYSMLNGYQITLYALFTLLNDIPFQTSNGIYETSEALYPEGYQYKITDYLLKPFKNRGGEFYLIWFGTAGHVLKHFLSMMLIVPAKLITLCLQSALYTSLMVTTIISVIILFFVPNTLQTYLFESLSSTLVNLRGNKEYEPIEQEKRTLTKNQYNISHFFLKYTQSPVHALDDAMPVIMILKFALAGLALKYKLPIMITIVSFEVAGSLIGTQLSEVKASLNELDKMKKPEAQIFTI